MVSEDLASEDPGLQHRLGGVCGADHDADTIARALELE